MRIWPVVSTTACIPVFRPSRTVIFTSATPSPSAWTSASPVTTRASATCVSMTPTRSKKTSSMSSPSSRTCSGWASSGAARSATPPTISTSCTAMPLSLSKKGWPMWTSSPRSRCANTAAPWPPRARTVRSAIAAWKRTWHCSRRWRTASLPKAPPACAPRSTWPLPSWWCETPSSIASSLPTTTRPVTSGASIRCTTSPTASRTPWRGSPTPSVPWSSRTTVACTTGCWTTSPSTATRVSTSSLVWTSSTPSCPSASWTCWWPRSTWTVGTIRACWPSPVCAAAATPRPPSASSASASVSPSRTTSSRWACWKPASAKISTRMPRVPWPCCTRSRWSSRTWPPMKCWPPRRTRAMPRWAPASWTSPARSSSMKRTSKKKPTSSSSVWYWARKCVCATPMSSRLNGSRRMPTARSPASTAATMPTPWARIRPMAARWKGWSTGSALLTPCLPKCVSMTACSRCQIRVPKRTSKPHSTRTPWWSSRGPASKLLSRTPSRSRLTSLSAKATSAPTTSSPARSTWCSTAPWPCATPGAR